VPRTLKEPLLAATGSDANVNLALQAKGTGVVQLASGYTENATACNAAVTGGPTIIPNNPAVQIYCYTLNAAATLQLRCEARLAAMRLLAPWPASASDHSSPWLSGLVFGCYALLVATAVERTLPLLPSPAVTLG